MSSHWVAIGDPGYIHWDITSLVAEWVAGLRPNYGVMMTDHNDSKSARFASRENTVNIAHIYRGPSVWPQFA